MGVRGVSGHELRAWLAPAAARGPRPTPPDSGGAQDAAPPARTEPDTREAQNIHSETAHASQPEAPVEHSGTRMRIDASSNRIVAQIMGANNEVIKQIPPEELLKISARIRDLQGVLFDKNV